MVEKELNIETPKKLKLEDLILEGTKVEIPITFDYPTSNGPVPVNAIIKPVTTVDWNNNLQKYSRDIGKFNLAILKLGLLSEDGEHLSMDLLEKMPAGVVNELLLQIQDISGIKQNEEDQYKLTKELMGF